MYRRISDRGLPLLRIYIGGSALLSCYNTLTDSRTLSAQLTAYSDGRLFIYLLGLLGTVVLLDVFINDTRKFKLRLPKIVEHRHILLSALALCYGAQPYIALVELRGGGLYAYYFWHVVMTMVAAYHDADKRSRDGKCNLLNA